MTGAAVLPSQGETRECRYDTVSPELYIKVTGEMLMHLCGCISMKAARLLSYAVIHLMSGISTLEWTCA